MSDVPGPVEDESHAIRVIPGNTRVRPASPDGSVSEIYSSYLDDDFICINRGRGAVPQKRVWRRLLDWLLA